MAEVIDKIFHHFAFTFFWVLVIAVIITTWMRIDQFDEELLKDCIDKGYTYNQCKGL